MPSLEITLEIEAERTRPHFTPHNNAAHSWVGEWETDQHALTCQIAREFQSWIEACIYPHYNRYRTGE